MIPVTAPFAIRRPSLAATLVLPLALSLAACGGGGGTSPAPVTTFTASTACASGPALTSTVDQATANALVPAACPTLTAAQVSAIAVNRNATSGAITLSGLPTGVVFSAQSVSFTLGSTTVNGTVDAAGVVTPTTPLSAGTWTWSFTGQPTNAALVVKTGTVVVPIAAPAATGYTYNPNLGGGGAWVADIGVLVTGANTLPAACLTVGDACWIQSVQNGTIKFVNSGVTIAPINNRPIVFAYYQTATGYYNTKPIYGDDGLSAATTFTDGGGNTSPYLTVKGSQNGVLYSSSFGGGSCVEKTFTGSSFSSNTVVCPI